ncbi:MAG: BTAD domain-containing putative transcriptional regulator [Magnetovibrio sp.]|nr:BTAD domain-containing putative transcriptional regulator [Magnetovibrio sp.]
MLRAYLLGDMRFTFGGAEIADLGNRQCGVLLAFLMLHPDRRFTREQIADALWEDHSPADPLKAVRHEIWSLRKALDGCGAKADDYVEVTDGTLGFHGTGGFWQDAAEVEARIADFGALAHPSDEDMRQLAEHLDLYQGDLLARHFHQWCLYPREALRDRRLCALERLLAHYEERRLWDGAIETARRILNADPLMESAHRSLMRAFYHKGSRAVALRQYETCRAQLRSAFDDPVEPMQETRDLYESIRRESSDLEALGTVRRPKLKSPLAGSGADAASELDTIRNHLRAADIELGKMIRDLSDG